LFAITLSASRLQSGLAPGWWLEAANDPIGVTGRALQAESSRWQWLVLRFCIRPLRGADRPWPSWISARVRSHSAITWPTLVVRSARLNLAPHFAGFNFVSTHMTQANLGHSLKHLQLLTAFSARQSVRCGARSLRSSTIAAFPRPAWRPMSIASGNAAARPSRPMMTGGFQPWAQKVAPVV